MQFYIPPRRARGIWQEYLDRQALEQRNRLEMAKRIMTWYSDLESEVADHFHKALQGSAPKRPRLAADDDGRSSVSLSLPPADGTPGRRFVCSINIRFLAFFHKKKHFCFSYSMDCC